MSKTEKLLADTEIKNLCQLGKIAGVERATLSRLVRGRIRKPGALTVARIALALDKPIEAVMEALGICPTDKILCMVDYKQH